MFYHLDLPPRTSHTKTKADPSSKGPTTPDTSAPDLSYSSI